jgi:hypothetical protein
VAQVWSLKNYYGLSVSDYDAILQKQGGVCAICGNTEPRGRLVVDHNHGDGKVRGLLCHVCNRALGGFKDSRNLLLKAVKYLDHHEGSVVAPVMDMSAVSEVTKYAA